MLRLATLVLAPAIVGTVLAYNRAAAAAKHVPRRTWRRWTLAQRLGWHRRDVRVLLYVAAEDPEYTALVYKNAVARALSHTDVTVDVETRHEAAMHGLSENYGLHAPADKHAAFNDLSDALVLGSREYLRECYDDGSDNYAHQNVREKMYGALEYLCSSMLREADSGKNRGHYDAIVALARATALGSNDSSLEALVCSTVEVHGITATVRGTRRVAIGRPVTTDKKTDQVEFDAYAECAKPLIEKFK